MASGVGLPSRIVFVAAVAALTGLGVLLIPPLVDQVTDFVEAVPDLVEDVTEGRGPLGFLEREYGSSSAFRTRSTSRAQAASSG